MKKWAIIYSSVTGNTKQIADAMAEADMLQGNVDVFRVQDAPSDLAQYEVVLLGYWLRLGAPDPLMLRYLPTVHDARVCFFQTHGTSPTSEHAVTSFARAGYHLGANCEILGTFGCRGKINPKMLEHRKNAGPNDPHGGPQSEERWRLASTHPDAQDFADAKAFVAAMQHKLALKEKYLAAKAAKAAAAKATAEAVAKK
ncbi:MAG: flavodoxin family protein [Selenomonas sp.]|uniref:flavodoxin family protein n=1 Tax=Selenomonas sp. TaxID=2053611 RepID=UPI0025E6B196|nr:flavodoxin family protein [Selenomonas sp.]MCI6085780.1 flavodoxin family protein [Selenomonas sp.]